MREKKMRAKLEDFLQEVCEKTITNNQYPVLTSSKSGLFLQSDYFNKQVASKDNTGYKIIRRGQFTYRAMSDTGEFFPNMLECADVGIVSPAYPVFEIIKQDQIVPEYLNYYFKSNRFQNSISTFAQGSTRTSVKFGKLKKVSIELPEIKKQYQIIRTLDLLRTIINNRKKEVLELDELIRARFVELFGEPGTNPMNWKETTIGEECFYIKDGPHKSLSDIGKENGGHPFISVRNIVDGYINFSNAKYISDEDYAAAIKKCHPEKGDMLYSKGGTTGIAKLIDVEEKFANWVHVAVLKFDKEKLNGVFFENMLNSTYCYEQSQRLTKGIANRDLVLSAMAQIKMYRPPLELQNQFAEFVAQIDKSKF